jgi:putative salt-induced outer membrane protein YdiY
MRRYVLALILLLAVPVIAVADEVQLRSGDRYTGRVIGLAGGTLTFKTPHGELKIPWADVTALSVTEPLRVTVGKQPPTTVTAMAVAAGGQVTLTPGGTVAIADIASISQIQPAVVVSGGANAGLLQTRGNTDVNATRADADATITQGANRYRATAAVNYAEDDDDKTLDNWTISGNYDRFLTSKLFFNANSIFTNDEFKDLDLRTALGAGLGYDFFKTPRFTLTAGAGLGWVNEDFIVAEDDSYTAIRESAALNYFIVLKRIEFFHKHDGYFGVTGEDNLFIKSQTGVRLTVIANFVTTIQFDLDYDKSPSPGRQGTDRTLSFTFGYRF